MLKTKVIVKMPSTTHENRGSAPKSVHGSGVEKQQQRPKRGPGPGALQRTILQTAREVAVGTGEAGPLWHDRGCDFDLPAGVCFAPQLMGAVAEASGTDPAHSSFRTMFNRAVRGLEQRGLVERLCASPVLRPRGYHQRLTRHSDGTYRLAFPATRRMFVRLIEGVE